MPPEVEVGKSIVGIILQHGLIGTITLVLAYVLYKREQRWTDLDAKKDAIIAGLQDARLADQKTCSLQHVDMMTKQFDTNAKTATALDGIERLLDKLPSIIRTPT